MRQRNTLWAGAAVAAVLLFGLLGAGAPAAIAAPEVFASPINGGCYIVAPSVCRIHIDPFTININTAQGAKLLKFTMFANGNPIYDFRTDVSNPPFTNYSPSLVTQDFAARCGVSYVVNIVGQDSKDASQLNMGQTTEFTCPTTVP